MKMSLPAVLPWLPLLAVAMAVGHYGSNIPYMDDWALLPLLDHYYQGTLQFRELWQPHNGHPLLVSRCVMLVLALATQWNLFAQLLFTLLCAIINTLLFWHIAAITSAEKKPLGTIPRLLISLLVFSLAQAWNWIWGWQLQIPLCLMFVLTGLLTLYQALAQENLQPTKLALAIACGVMASLSFGAGLLFWPAALPIMFMRNKSSGIVWLLLCACIAAAYWHWFYGSSTDSTLDTASLAQTSSAGMTDVLRAIAGLCSNMLAALGSLIARFHFATAAFIAAAACISSLIFVRKHQQPLLLSLLLFSIGSALMIAITRSFSGSEQMLASRYPTLMLPFWIALLLLIRQHWQQQRVYQLFACGVILAGNLISSVYSLQDFQLAARRFAHGHEALLDPHSANAARFLPAIGLSATEDFAVIDTLKKYRLSLFAEDAQKP